PEGVSPPPHPARVRVRAAAAAAPTILVAVMVLSSVVRRALRADGSGGFARGRSSCGMMSCPCRVGLRDCTRGSTVHRVLGDQPLLERGAVRLVEALLVLGVDGAARQVVALPVAAGAVRSRHRELECGE